MLDHQELESVSGSVDVGDYCRRVEEHLTRVNEGELIRIFGHSFEMVRAWALEGIPLSIVFAGIDRKAERHARGAARRALRLEFCEADVRAAFDEWRRAVGLWTTSAEPTDLAALSSPDRRRPSLTKMLERAADRLVRAAGRMDTPEPLREALSGTLEDVLALRDRAKKARGVDREHLLAALGPLDHRMLESARTAVGPLSVLQAEAEAELASYRSRLAPEIWDRSVAAAVDRLLRERYGLPVLDAEHV